MSECDKESKINTGNAPNAGIPEFSAEGPGGFKFRARGYDSVVALLIVGLSAFSYLFYTHHTQTMMLLVSLTDISAEMLRVKKLETCLLTKEVKDREIEYSNPGSWCNKMLGTTPVPTIR